MRLVGREKVLRTVSCLAAFLRREERLYAAGRVTLASFSCVTKSLFPPCVNDGSFPAMVASSSYRAAAVFLQYITLRTTTRCQREAVYVGK